MRLKNPIQAGIVLSCCVALIVFVAGCAQPPKQEIDAANAALQAAVSAGAEIYAADELKTAQDISAKLNGEMEKKEYKAAKQTAIQLKEAADKAKAAGEAGKAKAKETAVALADEVKQGLEKARGLVAEAGKAKLPVKLLQPVKDQLASAEAGTNELDGMVAAEKFKEVEVKGAQLKAQLAQIEQGIQDAKAKAAPPKKVASAKKAAKKKK